MTPPNSDIDELTFGIDLGTIDGDKTALTLKKGGKVYLYVDDDAEVVLAFAAHREKALLDRLEKLDEIIIQAIMPPSGEKAGVTEFRTKQAIIDLFMSDVIGKKSHTARNAYNVEGAPHIAAFVAEKAINKKIAEQRSILLKEKS